MDSREWMVAFQIPKSSQRADPRSFCATTTTRTTTRFSLPLVGVPKGSLDIDHHHYTILTMRATRARAFIGSLRKRAGDSAGASRSSSGSSFREPIGHQKIRYASSFVDVPSRRPIHQRIFRPGLRYLSSGIDEDSFDDQWPPDPFEENPPSWEENELDEASYENFEDLESDHDNYHKTRKNSKSEKPVGQTSERIFLDPKAPLEEKVNRFVNRRLGELHPLDITLSSVDLIRECGKRNSFEGMQYAHDVLDRILEEKRFVNQRNLDAPNDDDNERVPYTIVIPERPFEMLMYGWSNLCRKVPFAPQRMREVLDLMIQEAEYDEDLKNQRLAPPSERDDEEKQVRVQGRKHSDVDPKDMFASMSCQPTVGIYNTLLQGLGQASYRSIAAAIDAENVLNSMERINRKRGWHTKPNTRSFMHVINAFGRTKHISSGDRAEGVLRNMIRFHEQQAELYQEETGLEYDLEDHDNNTRHIVTPDVIAYTAVIKAHGNSGGEDSAAKSLALLTEVLRSTDPNLVADSYVFAATMNTFAKMAAQKKSPKRRLEAAEGAEDILYLMLDTIGSGMTTTKTSEASHENPYVVPFNICLNAWAQSNIRESPFRAEELLKKMLQPSDGASTLITPNVISFNTCMQAWARASPDNPEAPEKAEDLLQWMEHLDVVKADVTSYTTVISAYAKSNRQDKVSQARRVLETLVSALPTIPNAHITAVPFTAVLKAAAHHSNSLEVSEQKASKDDAFGVTGETFLDNVDGHEDPYSIALQTYHEVASDLYELGVEPDHLACATMVDVIERHTNPDSIERRQRLEQIFEDACAAGEVSAMVVQALAKACPSKEMLQTLLQVTSWPFHSVNALPRQWIRKVEPKFRKVRIPRNRTDSRKQNKTVRRRAPSIA